jgi:hypothetical protein
MSNTPPIAGRLRDMVGGYNRELAAEALGKALLGVVVSFFVFGFVFWCGWFVGFAVADSLNLEAWQFGALLSGLFLVVATWSAWRRVDPLAAVQPLSDRQLLLTLISQASPGLLYFSPRHATAGAAVVLIGGPANVFQALGIWASRIRADGPLLEEASRLVAACNGNCPIEEVREPVAALLLRRLGLIKVIPNGDSSAFTLTEKGLTVLGGAKARGRKRSRGPRAPRDKGWG